MPAPKNPVPQMFRVSVGQASAGVIVIAGRVTAAAPALQWAIQSGMSLSRLRRVCRSYRWSLELIEPGPAPAKRARRE